jgi:hypothetical protein
VTEDVPVAVLRGSSTGGKWRAEASDLRMEAKIFEWESVI